MKWIVEVSGKVLFCLMEAVSAGDKGVLHGQPNPTIKNQAPLSSIHVLYLAVASLSTSSSFWRWFFSSKKALIFLHTTFPHFLIANEFPWQKEATKKTESIGQTAVETMFNKVDGAFLIWKQTF